jgi:glycosyltransferase involved in cell wall biosynthesis
MRNDSPNTKADVAVLLPVYNGAKYIAESIRSILNQTYHNFTLIIINDGSNDDLEKILKNFLHDKRIILITNAQRIGISKSLNKAINFTRTDFIARIDADDIADSKRLETQIKYLRMHPNVGIVGSRVALINSIGKVIGYSNKNNNMSLKSGNYLYHSSVMFRRSLYKKYGGYDATLDGAEDYDLWLRYCRHTHIAVIPRILLKYRIHQRSVSFSSIKRIQKAYIRAKIKSVYVYKYPYWHLIYCLKPLVSQLIPLPIYQNIYSKFLKYEELS